MPNPKHKISKSRRDKRRTHYKAVAPTVALIQQPVKLIYGIVLTGMKANFTTKEEW